MEQYGGYLKLVLSLDGFANIPSMKQVANWNIKGAQYNPIPAKEDRDDLKRLKGELKKFKPTSANHLRKLKVDNSVRSVFHTDGHKNCVIER